jgi:hypothetical protein
MPAKHPIQLNINILAKSKNPRNVPNRETPQNPSHRKMGRASRDPQQSSIPGHRTPQRHQPYNASAASSGILAVASANTRSASASRAIRPSLWLLSTTIAA